MVYYKAEGFAVASNNVRVVKKPMAAPKGRPVKQLSYR
jgi:hypothetical protein